MDESAKAVTKSGASKQKSQGTEDFQVSKEPPLSVLSKMLQSGISGPCNGTQRSPVVPS